MMDDHSLNVLDFSHLLGLLKAFSCSPLGRKRCEALRPSGDARWIRSRLADVVELKKLLETEGPPPLSDLKDIEEILKRVDVEESVLTVQELMELCGQISLAGGVRRYVDGLDESRSPLLREKTTGLSHLKSLEKAIFRAVNAKGEILDGASASLLEIRDQLRATREKAKGVLEHLLRREDLQSMFQEQLVTLRNGRYVVLIKSDHEHRLQGIVHDQSQSRMTFFFEPLQVVSHNNEISILMGEEKEEEYRILAELSKKARAESEPLWRNFEILGELDFLCAMAKFSTLLKSVEPMVGEEGRLEMREARHPLLVFQKKERVVPIELRVGDGHRVLILSGANAGGKTVALKTLGLLTLMVQCGLPIPVAEGSRATVFENIFAVIGDEQNIGENLSTFSSHLIHLNHILEKAGPRSLVLLDELGVGTHASEGCALAMGFLDQLRQRGSTVIVTTHFDRLKIYGYLHPDCENVAVEFDEKTLEPKYTLAYGSSGLSNAFLIAEKLGFSDEVLRRAREHQTGGKQEITEALTELERLKAAARKDQQELLEIKEEAGLERQRLRRLLDGIREKRQSILAQAEEKARKTARKFEEELKEWIHRQKEERKASLRPLPSRGQGKEIQEIKERAFPTLRRKGPSGTPTGLKVGDRVRIEGFRPQGILTKMEGASKRVEVMMGNRRVKTSLSEIVKVAGDEEKREGGRPETFALLRTETEEGPSEINIIGLTVDEALPVVDKFIDQALVQGLEKVRIIHGMGSGRLRNAVSTYLRKHPRVKHHALGDPMKRGGGVTFVDLS